MLCYKHLLTQFVVKKLIKISSYQYNAKYFNPKLVIFGKKVFSFHSKHIKPFFLVFINVHIWLFLVIDFIRFSFIISYILNVWMQIYQMRELFYSQNQIIRKKLKCGYDFLFMQSRQNYDYFLFFCNKLMKIYNF